MRWRRHPDNRSARHLPESREPQRGEFRLAEPKRRIDDSQSRRAVPSIRGGGDESPWLHARQAAFAACPFLEDFALLEIAAIDSKWTSRWPTNEQSIPAELEISFEHRTPNLSTHNEQHRQLRRDTRALAVSQIRPICLIMWARSLLASICGRSDCDLRDLTYHARVSMNSARIRVSTRSVDPADADDFWRSATRPFFVTDRIDPDTSLEGSITALSIGTSLIGQTTFNTHEVHPKQSADRRERTRR